MRGLLAGLLFLVACSGGAGGDVTTTTTLAPTTTTVAATTTTEPPVECPPAPYELSFLPTGVGQGELDTETLEPDVWTSVAGSNTTFVPRNDDTVAIALIRGTLPAVDWPAERGEVTIDPRSVPIRTAPGSRAGSRSPGPAAISTRWCSTRPGTPPTWSRSSRA